MVGRNRFTERQVADGYICWSIEIGCNLLSHVNHGTLFQGVVVLSRSRKGQPGMADPEPKWLWDVVVAVSVILGILVLILVIVVVYCVRMRRRKHPEGTESGKLGNGTNGTISPCGYPRVSQAGSRSHPPGYESRRNIAVNGESGTGIWYVPRYMRRYQYPAGSHIRKTKSTPASKSRSLDHRLRAPPANGRPYETPLLESIQFHVSEHPGAVVSGTAMPSSAPRAVSNHGPFVASGLLASDIRMASGKERYVSTLYVAESPLQPAAPEYLVPGSATTSTVDSRPASVLW